MYPIGSPRSECEFTHFKLTFCLIFFFKFSFVTNSSFSSRSAYMLDGSLILTLMHSWRTTSSTASVASIRTRTVVPSWRVTLFVGTSLGLLAGEDDDRLGDWDWDWEGDLVLCAKELDEGALNVGLRRLEDIGAPLPSVNNFLSAIAGTIFGTMGVKVKEK